MGCQVALSPSARRELRGIVRYISVDSPERAGRFGQLLVDTTKRLAEFPELGRWFPSSTFLRCARLSFVPIASSTGSIVAIAALISRGSGTARAEIPNSKTPDGP